MNKIMELQKEREIIKKQIFKLEEKLISKTNKIKALFDAER